MDRAEMLQILRTTPDKIGNVAVGMTRQHMQRPRADGEWSIPEILKHMALYERDVIGPRLRLMLAEDNPTFPPPPEMMDPNGRPPVVDFGADLALLRRHRLLTIAVLEDLDEAGWQHPGVGPRGPTTVERVVEHLANHDLEHLQGMEDARTLLEDETEHEAGGASTAGHQHH